MALNFYYEDTLEKETMQRTQQFSAFVCYRKNPVKVAEHSFSARSCWCDSARAQGLQKQTCRWYSDHFICSIPALSLPFFFVIERSVLMTLVLYNEGMLEKVTTQRTQQFSERTQLNAAHAQYLEKLRPIALAQTSWFLTIQSLEFQEIWQNNSSGPTWMIYREKSEFWHREFLIIQKTI